MTDTPCLSSFDDTPIYTIKTVVQQTGVAPATLRAWERRYGVLSPGRSGGGYRLYSERDIATLRWLKIQLDGGVTISRAVARLEMHHRAGEEPELAMASTPAYVPPAGSRTVASFCAELVEELLAFREASAEALLNEAFALCSVEAVVEDVVTPALVEVGDRWHRGEATIVQEHFATAFLRRRLAVLYQAYAAQPGDVREQALKGRLALTGSAPGEWHDVGILIVSLLLRRHGWRVIYLGQNVPAAHLVEEVSRLRPGLICLSAATLEGAAGLLDAARALGELPEPRPLLAFGGWVFHEHPELRDRLAGAHIGGTARDLIAFLTHS